MMAKSFQICCQDWAGFDEQRVSVKKKPVKHEARVTRLADGTRLENTEGRTRG
jgi:hypothetical protein